MSGFRYTLMACVILAVVVILFSQRSLAPEEQDAVVAKIDALRSDFISRGCIAKFDGYCRQMFLGMKSLVDKLPPQSVPDVDSIIRNCAETSDRVAAGSDLHPAPSFRCESDH